MSAEKKRIFIISPYPVYPVADGAVRRIDGINQRLIAKDCQVFMFAPQSHKSDGPCPDDNIQHIHYLRKRKYNYFINIDLSRTLKKHISRKPDLIILHFPYLSRMVFPIARKYKIPVHLDEHNIEHQRFKDMGQPFIAMLIYLFERHAVKKARSISVTSKMDADTIKRKFGRASTVVENFIDTERFYPIKKDEKMKLKKSLGLDFPKIVIYFGNFTNISTKQAYKIIRDKIAPALLGRDPQIKIIIIGKGLKKSEPPVKNMIVIGEVNNIERYIQLSDVAIVPLVSGGGTRFKVIEALGCGVPVISTPKGIESLDLKLEEGVILSTEHEFPDKIIEYFRDEFLSESFPTNLDNVMNKYSCSSVLAKLDLRETFGIMESDQP